MKKRDSTFLVKDKPWLHPLARDRRKTAATFNPVEQYFGKECGIPVRNTCYGPWAGD